MHAALKLQCGRVTGNKKSTIGGFRAYWSFSVFMVGYSQLLVGPGPYQAHPCLCPWNIDSINLQDFRSLFAWSRSEIGIL